MIKYSKLLLIIMFLCISCEHAKYKRSIVISSPDSSQHISIITIDNIRYIHAGVNKSIPDSDFVKIDISRIGELGDEIGICWERKADDKSWVLVNHGSEILYNSLKEKFIFKSTLEVNESGIPTMEKFLGENCSRIDFYYNLGVRIGLEKGYNIYPEGSAIVYR